MIDKAFLFSNVIIILSEGVITWYGESSGKGYAYEIGRFRFIG